MNKRGLVFILLCLGLVLAVLLAGCGTPEKTTTPTTTTKPPTATAPPQTSSPPAPVVEAIVADPASVDLTGKATMQLRITSVYNNGYEEVVTFQSRYTSEDTKIATVSVGGLVTAVGAGATNIKISYTLGKTTKTLSVPVTVK